MNVCAALRCEPQVATHGLRRKNNVWTHKTETAPDIEVILLFGMWAGIRRGWYYIGCLFVLDLSPVTSKFHLNPPLRSQLTAVVVWRWSGLHWVQGIRILVGSRVDFFSQCISAEGEWNSAGNLSRKFLSQKYLLLFHRELYTYVTILSTQWMVQLTSCLCV